MCYVGGQFQIDFVQIRLGMPHFAKALRRWGTSHTDIRRKGMRGKGNSQYRVWWWKPAGCASGTAVGRDEREKER